MFTRAKLIYYIHENVNLQIFNKDYIPMIFRKLLSAFYSTLERMVLPLFDEVVVAGNDIADYYKKRIVLNNYPILQSFHIINEKRNNNIVYVGKIQEIYGIYYLIEAIKVVRKKYPDVRLLLIGDFADEAIRANVLCNDGMEFLGWKSMQEIYEITSQCLGGVVNYLPLPNHLFLRSNKVFEYMHSGVPVIYPAFKEWKEALDNLNICIAVNPDKSYEIAAAIEYLINHLEEAKIMGENGRKAVEEKYNWHNEEKKLFAVYQEILGES